MDIDATASETPKSLMSSQSKSSQLQVVVHPVVLFGLSDHVSRHFIRQQEGPIVGAILGQQNSREITMEHSFECHLRTAPEVDGGYLLDHQRFSSRLEQMITVHKDRNLEFVGWYTLLPPSGPQSTDLPIHKQILDNWNDSAILLGFHCSEAGAQDVAGKAPVTMYETIYEVDDRKTGEQDGEDKTMQDGEATLQLRFRPVPYSIETDETELISMNYVAAGSGTATAVSTSAKEDRTSQSIEAFDKGKGKGKGKGKRRLVDADGDEAEAQSPDDAALDLTREEDEMIAALTAKANALKMLHARIRLLTAYLEGLPPSFLNGHTGSSTTEQSVEASQTTPSHCILRQIRALVNRLDLVVPTDKEDFEAEMEKETNNVNLTNLMNNIMQSMSEASQTGKKFSIVDLARFGSSGKPDMLDPGVLASSSSFDLRVQGVM
ncbi:hypothetical protein E4U43_007290 [Claviceps pusilla]|uniref:COP9 signalosome complex subunit 6 n=1 Tax=Claviceps pusilla TaxID=123648 RepID=A0A9P7NEQ3_9HYPO|nr:hypothetical protein E4U43_007290 [Claviceps pusilla]